MDICQIFSRRSVIYPCRSFQRHTCLKDYPNECAGHFLLTNLLLDDLKATASDGGDARIVVISSGMHDAELAKKRGGRQYIINYRILV